MTSKLELIQKIKALAVQGKGGEAINAKKKLDELMKKYNISEEDISEEKIKEFGIKAYSQIDKSLLNQVCFSVYGNINEKKYLAFYTKKKSNFIVHCTDAEFLEIKAKFDFYKKAFKRDLNLFYSAFIQANMIFPPEHLTKPNKNKGLSAEDRKILLMAQGIEKSEFRKQIEG